MDSAIPFAQDYEHASYDSRAVGLFWRQLLRANRALTVFRSGLVGKVSPVHFFWGAMDLACTRFSGRPAPPHPGGAPNCPAWVMREGYSHELASCGFWPGGGDEGAFYAYAYPEPGGYADHRFAQRMRRTRTASSCGRTRLSPQHSIRTALSTSSSRPRIVPPPMASPPYPRAICGSEKAVGKLTGDELGRRRRCSRLGRSR